MKLITISSAFDEISALRWRMKPLAALGRVVVCEDTVLIVYDDDTLWCSAIAGKQSKFDQVSIYPRDQEFGGLFKCLVAAKLISKQTSEIVMKAINTYHMNHPGRISSHCLHTFTEYIKTYGSPNGMKRAKREYDRLIQKNVKEAIITANAEYAKRQLKLKK